MAKRKENPVSEQEEKTKEEQKQEDYLVVKNEPCLDVPELEPEKKQRVCPRYVFELSSDDLDFTRVTISEAFNPTGGGRVNNFSVDNPKNHPILVLTNDGLGGKFNKNSIRTDKYNKHHLQVNIVEKEKKNVDKFEDYVLEFLAKNSVQQFDKKDKEGQGESFTKDFIVKNARNLVYQGLKIDKTTKKAIPGEKWPPSFSAAIFEDGAKKASVKTESGKDVHFLNLDGYEWTKISVEVISNYFMGTTVGYSTRVVKITLKDKELSDDQDVNDFL